ncbi:hemicentin-2-like [Anopheles darlingi]|uniref:hemicentin-2-like n=1 Tax=Anopheles darlingi TaxID=43151 RepID=UPI00210048D3|nr:hemicentin-2-like [Anopheles darlingi]
MDINMPYGSMLIITNASALMVGRYYCVHSENQQEDLDEMEAENVANSIYVYVDDPHQLVVPHPVKSYNNSEGVVVLCKPSHPEVELELCDFNYERCVTTLDPTKGFFLQGGAYNRTAEFYCYANGMKHTAKLDINNEEGLIKPTIYSNVGDYVPIGTTVHLTCSYQEYLDRNVEISWKTLPSYQPSEIDETIFVGNQTRTSMNEQTLPYLFKRDLIIENVTLAHKRTYRCEVFDDKNNTYYHNFKLQVRETPDDFVILSTAHDRRSIQRMLNENGETTPIEIKIRYKAFPSRISYEWFRDETGIIHSNNDKTDEYKMEVTEDSIKLRIKRPKMHHSDLYTVAAKAGTASANFSIVVDVCGKPSLKMDSIKAVEGDFMSFQCLAESNPSTTTISFLFQPCKKVPWGNCSIVNDTDAGWQEGTDEVYGINWSSATHRLITNTPGILYCKASNWDGDATTQAYLMLEKVSNFMVLEIIQPKGNITVGDDVTLHCSVVSLGNIVSMVFEHNGGEYQGTVMQNDSLILKMELTLFDVQLSDAGDIHCFVIYLINKEPQMRRLINMEVTEGIAPYLQSGDMDQTIVVDVLKPINLECDVVGVPEPSITWLKDGAPFVYNLSNPTDMTAITIQYAIPTQSGLYECIAENKMGNITITKNVTVRIPEITRNQPLIYVTVVLLMLTITLKSLLLYVKIKQTSRDSNVAVDHLQIVPPFDSSE